MFHYYKIVPVLNSLKHDAMKTYGGRRYNSTIHDLDTRWKRIASYTPRSLYPKGNKPPLPIRYEAEWAPELVWTLPGFEPRPSSP
jgi:hypothetical protein